MSETSIQQQYQDYYSRTQATLGRGDTGLSPEDGKFFLETEKQRYRLYPYFPELMEFNAWTGKKVLEVGVGEGTDHSQFAKGGAQMWGVDLTPRHLEITRKRLDYLNLTSHLQQADAEKLPFADNTFDLVYSCGVLFLVPGIDKAVAEIHRVLKPGGKVIALFYHTHSFLYYLNILLYHGVVAGELRFLTADKLKDWYAGDGLGYPPMKYFTKKELGELFGAFKNREFFVNQLDCWPVPGQGWIMPKKVLDFLSRRWGYFLTIKAFKAEA